MPRTVEAEPVFDPAWRPVPRIRVIAIGIARRDARILVAEVRSDDGRVKGWRPPGGMVEFGETAEAALEREFREEFGCDIRIVGAPFVCENLYAHEGTQGHEIVFSYPIRFADPDFASQDRFLLKEDDGTSHWVEWVPIECFASGAEMLFPAALLPMLVASAPSTEDHLESRP